MRFTVILLSMFVISCTTIDVTPVPTGGSKADGTVVLTYEYGELQQPIVDMSQADADALKRCKAWGYRRAEAFEGTKSSCIMFGGFNGCARTQVDITYQCLK